jgi:hypothetical protein
VFADNQYPDFIDLPQRFGEAPVTQLDPGHSTLRVDLPVVTLGVSTANQQWGPAINHPVLLGNNAAGFLHGFVGTGAPINVLVGHLHGRAIWGRLDQSQYSPVEGVASRRFMSGLVAVFMPRGAPGLEIGGGRFFHTPWPSTGLTAANFLKPFESFIKSRLPDRDNLTDKSDPDNQLASVFARWVFPRSGFEAYGEFGREDHNFDVRDLLLEPDHASAFLLGARKVWQREGPALMSFRGELLNAQPSHLDHVRQQVPFYIHSGSPQGHTQRGQLLGSAAAFGGAALVLAGDYYHPGGRWTLGWSRQLRQERHNRTTLYWTSGDRDPQGLDVTQAINAEALFIRRRVNVTAGVTGVYNQNRNFESNVFNLNAALQVRLGL